MANYIDLVAVRLDCETTLLLAQAPWCSPIEDGMTVICKTPQGEKLGTVEVVSRSVNVDDETIRLAKTLAKMPKSEEIAKVISYFEKKDIDYDK